MLLFCDVVVSGDVVVVVGGDGFVVCCLLSTAM